MVFCCRPRNMIEVTCPACGKQFSLDPSSTSHAKLRPFWLPLYTLIPTRPIFPPAEWYCPPCGEELLPEYKADMAIVGKAFALYEEYQSAVKKWEKSIEKIIYEFAIEYQRDFFLPSSFAERMRPMQPKPKPFDKPVPKNKQYHELQNDIFALFHKPLKTTVKTEFPFDRMLDAHASAYEKYLQKVSPIVGRNREYSRLEPHYDFLINLGRNEGSPVAYLYCKFSGQELIRSYNQEDARSHLKQAIGPCTANLSSRFTEAVLKKYVHDGTALPPQGEPIPCWNILPTLSCPMS